MRRGPSVHVEQPWRKARSPGDLTIRWTRRSRALVAESWTKSEVPLAQKAEAHEVESLDGAVLKGLSNLACTASLVGSSSSQTIC